MSYNVAIVGAGIGGLSAAVALSRRPGLKVTVFEAGSVAGGKLGREFYDGVAFDTGPSLLTLPDILTGLLQERGLSLEEELTLFRPRRLGRYDFPDGTSFLVGHSLEETKASIRDNLGERAAGEFADFMAYARTIWEAARPYFIEGPAPTMSLSLNALKLGINALRALKDIDATHTMAQAIKSRVRDERLQSVFLRYATFNGSDPRRAPATLNCISWVDLGRGGWGVEGGMFQIVSALERVAREGGVEFFFDAPVEQILRRSDNRWEVAAATKTAAFDAVVVNADVRHLLEDLLDEKLDPQITCDPCLSTSGYTFVVRTPRTAAGGPERAAHRVLFPEGDYLEEFAALFDRNQVPSSPTIYRCAQEQAHRRRGWPEKEPLFVMVNAPALGESVSDTNWEEVEEEVLCRLRQAGEIDAAAEVVWRRCPAGLAAQFPGSRGSLYGAASNSKFSAFRRPPNQVAALPGLFLASGSAHPGGGVPLCVQSGRRAAQELLERWRNPG